MAEFTLPKNTKIEAGRPEKGCCAFDFRSVHRNTLTSDVAPVPPKKRTY